MSDQAKHFYAFGPFRLDSRERVLLRDDQPIPLNPKAVETLLLLVENAGQLVDKDELMKRVWPDTFVEEGNLTKNIFFLRKALGRGDEGREYIQTVPRRGYRFTAEVQTWSEEEDRTETADADRPCNRATENVDRIDRGRGRARLSSAALAGWQLGSVGVSPEAGAVRQLRQEPVWDPVVSASLIKGHKKAVIGILAVLVALVALAWLVLRRPPQPSAELTQKRLTFNSGENTIRSAAISPDGKYLGYSDAAGLHLKLLATGEERLLPRPAGVPPDTIWYVDSWFPDGTQVLADANEPGGRKSIWTVSVLGQYARELREDASGFEASPDGTRIAFGPPGPFNSVRTWDPVREIWVMGSRGDNPQKVLALGENEGLYWVHWSPDGKRMAYIRKQRSPDQQMSIETCDLRGANRRVVVSNPHLWHFCWLPGGRIIYSSDEDLWQIGIDDHAGAPIGKAKRITQWAGSELWGLSATTDGKRLIFQRETERGQVYLAQLAAGGTRISPPQRLTKDEGDDNPTGWTANSKVVLFSSNIHGTLGIFKHGITEDTTEPVVTAPQVAVFPRISSDGAWLLYLEIPDASANAPSRPRLMRIPVRGGVPQFVLETPRPWWNFECAPTPASVCVILETTPDGKWFTVTAFDPLKGRGKVLRTIEKDPAVFFYGSGLSPDGSTFAISRTGEAEIRIRLLSLSVGPDREITVKGWPNLSGLGWSADGKGLYCGSVSPQSRTLLHVDLAGNASVLWQLKGPGGPLWSIPSPDGRYLAIRGDIYNSDVWMLEGF
jgi:DNA-binding winged helix-turn-helix (wHTH) protein/Tol biopolymer transport system component